MHVNLDVLARCWVLAGPTAVGKSAVALELAGILNAEIVALDSMTLYRGMDIGTAKRTLEDQAFVPHHLIDIIDPHEEFSVAEYLTLASRVCEEILQRDRIPLFVGGTGLYLRSLLRGLFEGPPADWPLRQRLESFAKDQGAAALHQKLRDVDPDSAAWLHINDQRRIIRALEVYELTGVPLSQLQQQAELPAEVRPRNVYWLEPPRDWLYERIDRRVDQMIAAGLVEEVRDLVGLPHGIGKSASQGLGYKEVLEHLAGRMDLTQTIELIQTRSRQFAKRQHTWFRNLPECQAFSIQGSETPVEIARELVNRSNR